MNMAGRLPLYLSFLIIVLLSSVLVSFITYLLQVDEVIDQQQGDQQARIQQRLTELQGTINDFNRRGDLDAIRRAISRLSVDQTLQILLVVDGDSIVRFSSVEGYGGQSAHAVASHDIPRLLANFRPDDGSTALAGNGGLVVANLPLKGIGSPNDDGQTRLVAVFDIQPHIQQALENQQRSIVQQVVIFVLVLVVAFLFLYANIRSRINRIIERTRRFIAGDHSARIALQGSDEFAAIARTFDQMAQEIQVQHENLNQLAHFDALTNLVNRAHLVERLERRVRAGQHKPFTVLFIDLDRFKVINDTLGHQMGDEMLQVVAHRIRSHVKDIDTLARFGGDEFVLLIESVSDIEGVKLILQRLLRHIGEPMMLGSNPVSTSASIGVACFPDDGRTAQALIQNADIAMYQAKGRGKNTYHFYRSETDAPPPGRLSLEHHLRQLIKRKEINLYYQPIYDARGHQLVGLEALAYLTGAHGEVLPPDTVIPVIEEAGLMNTFGELVLRQAVSDYQAWLGTRHPAVAPYLALNLSCSQLDAPEFLSQVDALLADTGVDPRDLEFEITESTVLRHVDQKLALLRAVRDRGIRIAIDDFGTGYSSLSYLGALPLDTLKIDRSFVRDLHIDKDDNAIVEAIIAMAAKLGLGVVAEGVENAAQLSYLLAHQCHVIQGYYFDRPAPLEDLWRDESRRLRDPVT